MGLPTREKQPDEIRKITFDFSEKMITGDTLTGSPTMIAETGLTVGSGSIVGATVTAFVSSGTLGDKYKVTCRCSTIGGEILELDCFVKIKEVN